MVEVWSTESKLAPHFAINCFPHDSLRQPVFTGPDGLRPHRSHILLNRRPLGTNPYTKEATWDTDYLWRPPPKPPVSVSGPRGLPASLFGPEGRAHGQPIAAQYLPATTLGVPVHLRPRSSFAGEIGWHQFAFHNLFPEAAWTGHQILTSEFRRELEDRWTHRYQNPWYPDQGERPDIEREGSYFSRFPDSGQRARTSHDDFRRKKSPSHSPSAATTPSSRDQHRPWRRTPAATPISTVDATQDRAVRFDAEDTAGDRGEVVSVEQSEEGGAAGRGGEVTSDGVERDRSSRPGSHTRHHPVPQSHTLEAPQSRATSSRSADSLFSGYSQRSGASSQSQRQKRAQQEEINF